MAEAILQEEEDEERLEARPSLLGGKAAEVVDEEDQPGAKRRRLQHPAGEAAASGQQRDLAADAPQFHNLSTEAAAGDSSADAGQGERTSPAAPAPCSHPTYWGDLCVVCGAPKPEDKGSDDIAVPRGGQNASSSVPSRRLPPGHPHQARGGRADGGGGPSASSAMAGPTRIKHMHATAHMEVAEAEAERLKRAEYTRLLSARKLVLILDLDHTLLNSVSWICPSCPHARKPIFPPIIVTA